MTVLSSLKSRCCYSSPSPSEFQFTLKSHNLSSSCIQNILCLCLVPTVPFPIKITEENPRECHSDSKRESLYIFCVDLCQVALFLCIYNKLDRRELYIYELLQREKQPVFCWGRGERITPLARMSTSSTAISSLLPLVLVIFIAYLESVSMALSTLLPSLALVSTKSVPRAAAIAAPSLVGTPSVAPRRRSFLFPIRITGIDRSTDS